MLNSQDDQLSLLAGPQSPLTGNMNEQQRREKREHDEAREIVMHTIDTLQKRYRVALLRKVLKDADATLFRQECRETLANFQANAVPKEVL